MSDRPKVTRDDPPMLPLGTCVNLRRQFKNSPWADRDQGWTVTGYTQKKGKWQGYLLEKAGIRSSASKFEAIDVVEESNG